MRLLVHADQPRSRIRGQMLSQAIGGRQPSLPPDDPAESAPRLGHATVLFEPFRQMVAQGLIRVKR